MCVLSQSLSLEFFIEIWIRIAYRSMDPLPMATPLKKISFSSQPLTACKSSVGREYPRSLSLHAKMLMGPVLWRSCASDLGCCEKENNKTCYTQNSRVLQLFLPLCCLWLLHSFCPIFHSVPWALEEVIQLSHLCLFNGHYFSVLGAHESLWLLLVATNRLFPGQSWHQHYWKGIRAIPSLGSFHYAI